jgi:hypothetical protein
MFHEKFYYTKIWTTYGNHEAGAARSRRRNISATATRDGRLEVETGVQANNLCSVFDSRSHACCLLHLVDRW